MVGRDGFIDLFDRLFFDGLPGKASPGLALSILVDLVYGDPKKRTDQFPSQDKMIDELSALFAQFARDLEAAIYGMEEN
jgi:hypothetical protein